jgi:hypothetical protein
LASPRACSAASPAPAQCAALSSGA